jgi:hypothetical protein
MAQSVELTGNIISIPFAQTHQALAPDSGKLPTTYAQSHYFIETQIQEFIITPKQSLEISFLTFIMHSLV